MSFFSLVWKMHQLCPLDAHIQFLKQRSESIFVYLTVNQDLSVLSFTLIWPELDQWQKEALYKKTGMQV